MKSRFTSIIQVVALIVAVFASSLSTAQSIFSNAITGNNTGNQNPYATNQVVVAGVTSTGIGRGAGVNNSNSTNTYNASNWSTNGTLNTGNNDYFSWTITPTGCNEVDFTNLILFFQRTTSGPQNIALRSSVDNYTTNIWTSALAVTTEQNATIDLSGIAFQNIVAPITFRLYGWNAATTNGNFSINSFDFQGAVVSSTPSAAGVVTGNTSICAGTSTALNVTGGFGSIQWQSSANNVTFANIAGATAATYNTPVGANDAYYRAVFTNGNCSSANSTSLFVDILGQTFTAVGNSSCTPAALTIGVSPTCPSALSTTNWYAAATGGSSLGTGNTFTTPVLNATTSYYAGATYTTGAALSTGNRSATLQRGLIFDAFAPLFLNSVQINTNGAGSITLELRNNLNQPVAGAAAVVFNAAAGTNTVPLNWSIPAGTGYRIIKTAGTIQFSRTDPFTFPIGVSGLLSITSSVSNNVADNTRYFYFYNWNVSTTRTEVIATIGGASGGSNAAVTACDSYTWVANGQTYFASGVYTHSTACANDTLDLTITPGFTNTTVASVCDSYIWSVDGNTYTTSGTYTLSSGCNTEILELTISPVTTNTTVATGCDMYVWSVDGQQYTESGVYTYVVDCVTEILDLTIIPSSSNYTVVSACDTYTWAVNGQQYTTSGTYIVEVGCLAEILELTITPSATNTTVISACDSYTWSVDGNTYSVSGTYTFVNGCNTEVLDLTITPSTNNTTTASACDSYTWSVDGLTYTTSGTYTSVNGCNTETLVLTITPSTNNTTTASVCDSYTWAVNGATYTTSGTYTSVTGCNTETLVLIITPSTNNTTTASACGSYIWAVNGTTYTTSGTYTSVTGCNTETLVLTITPITNNTTTASACGTYTWAVNGTTYTTSGTYTSVTGCNTETLVLTITPITNNTTTASACNTYTWAVNGVTYSTSGTYTSVTGCNTETLVLTITPTTNNTTSMTACDTYTWAVNGVTYTASGTYTFTSACQTETLNLTIQTSSLYFVDADLDGFGSSVSQLACAGATGYSLNSSDCNDSNSSVNPSATEICNTIDDNCNSQTDEGLLAVFFIDNDGDTFGNPSATTLACSQPAGYASNDADCNDTDASVNPAAIEVGGNNIDENCDGQIDISVFELNSNIALYPNPTQSELNIQVNSSIIGSDLFIFDAVGNLVYNQKILSTQTAISVSNLANGNYIARVGELVKRFEVIK